VSCGSLCKRAGVVIWAAVCAMVVAAACTYSPAPEGALSAYFRNDSDAVLVVELRWENGSWNYKIPARSRGFLVATDADDVVVARVYSADCTPLGAVELSGKHSIIYVDPESRLFAHEWDYYFYHPTPYMTEFDLFGSDLVASCSGD